MFTNNISLYGIYGETADKLKEEGLFERIIDVYICGAAVGLIYDSSEELVEESTKNRVNIFAEQLNNEEKRLRYLASIAYLLENSNDIASDADNDKLLKEAFGDWYYPNKELSEIKYRILHKYALKGIKKLKDNVIKDSSNREEYFMNFEKFIKKLSDMNPETNIERAIISALMNE